MRRAAIQAIRTARFSGFTKVLSRSQIPQFTHEYLGFRSASFWQPPKHGQRKILQSSMYVRNFSVALISTLVASGAWFAYKGIPPGEGDSLQSANNTSIAKFSTSSRSLSSPIIYSTSSQAPPNSASKDEAAKSTRRALVVDDNQIYTGDIVGDGPLSKETDDSGRKTVEMLTPEQATERLRRNEESYLVGRGRGVVRYDVVQIPSNDPIEDDHAEKIVEVPSAIAPTDGSPSSDWMFWGVYDGHSGWTTSAKLREVLISFVVRELNSAYKSAVTNPSETMPSPEAIDAAIKKGFTRLDDEIVYQSVEKVMKANTKLVAAELLAPALSGSVALLSFYDSHSKNLRVACTGDARAVLGRRGPDGKWMAIPLSEDQTGDTPSEIERLRREHPGEERVVVSKGRVLGGLQPTRAFGDAVYKWSRETQEKLKRSFFARTPFNALRSPPYVTAEPVVTTTKIEPKNGDFIVMASDGLWEMLTNEEAIGLVGQWLETEGPGATSRKNSWLPGWLSGDSNNGLPISKDMKQQDESGQRAPIRQQQWSVPGAEDRFVIKDKNAATHLVRNALGGKDQDMLCALLTLPSPFSRRYRDDLTVEVIFFGEGDKSGNVVLNREASATEPEPKSKL